MWNTAMHSTASASKNLQMCMLHGEQNIKIMDLKSNFEFPLYLFLIIDFWNDNFAISFFHNASGHQEKCFDFIIKKNHIKLSYFYKKVEKHDKKWDTKDNLIYHNDDIFIKWSQKVTQWTKPLKTAKYTYLIFIKNDKNFSCF